jgi:hypothetical protein
VALRAGLNAVREGKVSASTEKRSVSFVSPAHNLVAILTGLPGSSLNSMAF